ncbi:MAG TPA: DUF1015 family protein [Polyangiaceae bacterium LLY-WYZ-15_(1-7)]|nr:hypothetical protein [Myxococcales bacterium]MAT27651.1 hypothetical protein [Sandaracinus sp.]HJK93076.1 DUF1015 family protein [Polyangiaceae bacterium LLY-WYZ-15_(1-7)]MBJ70021.1 hypothetical protein [Sandaracinus sp.]HJL05657.1 DUF1015 family protein [Polyangiaceae bacterium LLY-WYZ-15_(1-7)]
MVAIAGLVGLRPAPEHVARVVSPPYDVIKPGSPLEARLEAEPASAFHVILGADPAAAIARLRDQGFLAPDDEPAYYVYEQRWADGSRTGVFLAVEVSDYAERQIIRHEKTFDEKVKGRIALAKQTGFNTGPVFLLAKDELGRTLSEAKQDEPLYAFRSEYGGGTDLHGIESRVWRVPAESPRGKAIAAALAPQRLYIADGHHRYHAALKGGQTHALAYVTDEAAILAYDRVVNGVVSFEEAKAKLDLAPASSFHTPPKHVFRLYHRSGVFDLAAKQVPDDVVGRLDCAILERELYPQLGLTHDHIVDPKHFDYYPESALGEMKAAVDRGDYELAIALHPVAREELMAVADAGLEDPDVVMPEKSTFFSPKIHTGLFLYRHTYA